jgi:DUF3071 family protein
MQELRFVAVSEDGSYAVLAVPGRSARYTLPIDERLRAVALGQTSRLAQYEIEVESPLRPKEIQARIRAGETAEEIADAAGIPVERVRWFEGPVLAERAYVAQQAQAASVRRAGDSSGPGPRLGSIVPERLSAAGTDPAEGQWDSRKRGDGNWQLSLMFMSGGRLHVAEWVFDPRRRHVMPDDDNAARLSLPDAELPPVPVSMPGEATVTPLAPRLGAVSAAGGGNGGAGGGQLGGRFRQERPAAQERPGAPERPAVSERQAAPERTAMSNAPASPGLHRPAHRDPVPPVPPAPERQSVSAQVPVDPPDYFDDSERRGPAPQRPPGSAPQPDAHDVQPELESLTATAPSAPAQSAGEPREPQSAAAEAGTPAPPRAAASAEPVGHATEQAVHPREGKKNARGRRSSVPSWDEIMLGSSRQRD